MLRYQVRMARKRTLFDIVRGSTQAEVAGRLGITPMRVSRIVRGEVDVDSEVIAMARKVWGSGFDEAGTLAEWVRLRLQAAS